MTVYLDVIWALNFLFDSLLLYFTAIILKRNVSLWRVLAGGLIGSLIIVLSFTSFSIFASLPLTKLFFSVVMTLCVFGYKRWRYFINGLLTLYLSTFLIGGSLIGVHYFIQFDRQLTESVLLTSVNGFGDPVSWLFVMIGFPAAWHFAKQRMENIEMAKIHYDQKADVFLTIGSETYRFTGLIDSGNQLYDPFSKLPVMFVSIHGRRLDMPASIVDFAEDPDAVVMGNKEIASEWQDRLKIIPCKVVGKEHQLIIAVKPDQVRIIAGNEEFNGDKSLVSFTMQKLSADDSFECILHPKMLTGQRINNDANKVS